MRHVLSEILPQRKLIEEINRLSASWERERSEREMMTAQTQLRTLTFGDRRISYNEADQAEEADSEKNFTSLGGGGQFSDLDSGVCEDVCCDSLASSPDTERKIIRPDVSTIRELTNFDEVKHDI